MEENSTKIFQELKNLKYDLKDLKTEIKELKEENNMLKEELCSVKNNLTYDAQMLQERVKNLTIDFTRKIEAITYKKPDKILQEMKEEYENYVLLLSEELRDPDIRMKALHDSIICINEKIEGLGELRNKTSEMKEELFKIKKKLEDIHYFNEKHVHTRKPTSKLFTHNAFYISADSIAEFNQHTREIKELKEKIKEFESKSNKQEFCLKVVKE